MSAYDPTVTAIWGDGEHQFCLKLGQLRELQDKCGAGIYAVYVRLLSRAWHIDDVSEIIRCGLVGADMKPVEAARLVQRYFLAPYAEHLPLAISILGMALVRPDDEKKPAVKKKAAKPKPPTGSTSGGST